ncbi:MAG TPA: deoxyribonuclease IV [Longimicrobiales bacterium]|nr:deoxyribonuclease IV [Longimicrobiales bacterium]
MGTHPLVREQRVRRTGSRDRRALIATLGTGVDELGAHVSSAGGVVNAPGRAAELDSVVLQLFTKQASRWAEREVTPEQAAAFREQRVRHGIRTISSHDSYLINLASPDPALLERSLESFRAELRRCIALGIDYLVMHPGNATDRDRDRGLEQNAAAIERALRIEGGETMVLLEHTADTGTALGSTFEELRRIIDAIAATERERVGVCLDTCHLWAAGYDIVTDYEGVMDRLDAIVGLDRVRLFHLNDSKTGLGSARDRHEHIGAGSIGAQGFRSLLGDARFAAVPKLLETPKDDDALAADRRNLAVLRSLRSSGKQVAEARNF